MFETVTLHTRVENDGKLRVELPSGLPPDSEVDVTVSVRARKTFADRAAWEAHVDRIAGSVPDLQRPDQSPIDEIEPL